MTEQREAWLFTFGFGQEYANHYVSIPGTWHEARGEMVRIFEPRWAFQYPDTPFERSKMADYDIRFLQWRRFVCARCQAVLGDQPGELCAECVDDVRMDREGEDDDANMDDERARLRGST